MDRYLKVIIKPCRLIACGIALCILSVTASSAAESEVRSPNEVAWFENSAALINGLNNHYTECVDDVKPSQAKTLKLGRLAFNSPRLLGGQAARMGMSCASCHPSGRSNHHFFIEQISSEAGTSDITHSFLSSAGGDEQFNPKPIPDLAIRDQAKFSDRNSVQFDTFLANLIQLEFDGHPTNKTIFDALKFYLEQLNIKHCNKSHNDQQKYQRFEKDWQQLSSALELLADPEQQLDVKYFIAQSARASLGNIYNSVGLSPSKQQDQALVKLSRDLQRLTNSKSHSLKNSTAKTKSIELEKIKERAKAMYKLLQSKLHDSAYTNTALEQHYLEK